MIYLDSAATTLRKPPSVARACAYAIDHLATPGRGGHRPAMAAAETAFACRWEAAALFDVPEPDRVVFTFNATHGLNIAIKTLVKPGSTVLISGYEHNAVTRPLRAIPNVTIKAAESPLFDRAAALEAFRRELTPEVDAVVCTHVSNVFGFILPIGDIAALCRQRGVPLIVDASQSAGCLPLSFRELGAAFVAMPGHKGLYGPQGTGLLLCGDGAEPLLEGGTGSASLDLEQPDFYPDRLESGTINTVGVLSMGAGMDYLNARGIGRIYRREMDYCAWVYRELSRMPHVKLLAESFRMGEKAPIVSFNVGDSPSEEIAAYLNRRGFALRGGFHCAGLAHCTLGTQKQGAVRFSPSHFNTPQQIAQFLTEIQKIKKIGLPKG